MKVGDLVQMKREDADDTAHDHAIRQQNCLWFPNVGVIVSILTDTTVSPIEVLWTPGGVARHNRFWLQKV